jgi:hypothetical protein
VIITTGDNGNTVLSLERDEFRDLFAAFALAGILGSEDLSHGEGYWTGQIATRAYSTADAMLAEREKEPKP